MDQINKTTYAYGSAPQQFGNLYCPSSTNTLPVVVVIHGGYWKDNHNLDSYATKALVNYLTQLGVAVWNIEYRRMEFTGNNTQAPWPAIHQDVASAIDFIAHMATPHNLNVNQVMVVGHSAGGTLATWTGLRAAINKASPLYQHTYQKVKRVVSIAGILNLSHCDDIEQPQQVLRLMGGKAHDVKSRYQACDPNLLGASPVPLHIIHGNNDAAVGVTQAKAYCQAHNTKLTILPDGDHFSMLPLDNAPAPDWALLQQILADEIALLGK